MDASLAILFGAVGCAAAVLSPVASWLIWRGKQETIVAKNKEAIDAKFEAYEKLQGAQRAHDREMLDQKTTQLSIDIATCKASSISALASSDVHERDRVSVVAGHVNLMGEKLEEIGKGVIRILESQARSEARFESHESRISRLEAKSSGQYPKTT